MEPPVVPSPAAEVVPEAAPEARKPERKRSRPSGGGARRAEQQAVAPQPTQPTQPTQQAETQPGVSSSPRKRSKTRLILGVVVGLAVIFYVIGRSSDDGEQACRAAVENGSKYLKAGNLVAAVQQSQATAQACTGKLAPLAVPFNTDLVRQTQKTCARPVAAIRSRLQAHRLASTQAALDSLDPACQSSADVAALKTDLAQAQGAAAGAATRAAQAIADNDADAARRAIAELDQIDRESRDTARLRADAAAIRSKVETPAAPAVPVVAAPAASAPVAAPAPVATPAPAASPARQAAPAAQPSATAEVAERFLKQAEAALQQRRFDVAKTYIESARQTDPSNPRIEPLARQVRERERQVLEQETTIK